MAVKQQIPSSTNAPKTLNFAKLRGVDFSTSPFEVASTRATDMKNLINEDGVNHKRQGWSENHPINEILSTKYYNEKIIAVHKTGNTTIIVLNKKILVFDENILKKEFDIDKMYDSITQADFLVRKNEVIVYCYAGINTLIYIVSLSKFNVSEFEPYVPTTTISINPLSSETSTRDSLDFANLLTRKITNSLIGNAETEFHQLYVTVDYSNISNEIFNNLKLYFYAYSEENMVDFELGGKISSFTYRSSTDDVIVQFRVEPYLLPDGSGYIRLKIYNALGEEIPLDFSGNDPAPFTNKISENNKLKVVLTLGGES